MPIAQNNHCKLVLEFVKETTDYCASPSQIDQSSLAVSLGASVVT